LRAPWGSYSRSPASRADGGGTPALTAWVLTARAEETKRAESTVPDFDFCYGTRRGL